MWVGVPKQKRSWPKILWCMANIIRKVYCVCTALINIYLTYGDHKWLNIMNNNMQFSVLMTELAWFLKGDKHFLSSLSNAKNVSILEIRTGIKPNWSLFYFHAQFFIPINIMFNCVKRVIKIQFYSRFIYHASRM